MKKLELEPTYETPYVLLDPNAGCAVLGRGTCESKPENADAFYAPIQQWIQDYIQSGNSLTLTVDVRYYNTSSSKWLYSIFEAIDDQYIHAAELGIDNPQRLQIIWRCRTTDDTEEEDKEDAESWLQENFNVPFVIQIFKPDQ